MIPTRKRVKFLKECLDSFNAKTTDKSLVELLVKVDKDDRETLDFISGYQSEIEINYILTPRESGYGSLHKFYNSLAQISDSEFLTVFNDDIEMITEGWEQKFIPYSGKNFVLAVKNIKIKDGVTEPIFENYNGNPSIPADFYHKLGSLSEHPMLDDWWVHVTNNIPDLIKWIDVIVWFKRPDGEYTDFPADSTFLEGRQHINWSHHGSPSLLNYIDNIRIYKADHPEKF